MSATFGDPRLPERFWEKVQPEPNTGCWLWSAHCDPAGYGRIRWEGEAGYAHRVAHTVLIGPVPTGLWIDHLCRVRACCNPAHLDAVTPYENRIRGEQGGMGAYRDHCRRGHPRVESNLTATRTGYFACLTCRREQGRLHMRAVKARKRALALASSTTSTK